MDTRLKLHAPEHLIYETRKHLLGNSDLRRRIGLPLKEIEEIWFILTQNIESHAQVDYQKTYSLALKVAPHSEDAPYLALALSMGIPVWSNDKKMKAQARVKVFTTHEIIEKLR